MDPTMLAQILMALGQGTASPLAHQTMENLSPQDIQQLIAQSFQPQTGAGALSDVLSSPDAATAGVSGAPSLYPPLSSPPGQPKMGLPGGPPGPPSPTAQPQQQRFPQVRMPEATRPIFSGGVAGSQKAPDPASQSGLSPAMALMQAILGPRAQRGGGRPQGQGMGSLGELLSGRS